MNERKDNLITRIKELTLLLGGEFTQTSTLNSQGRSSKKIVIEYDINAKNE